MPLFWLVIVTAIYLWLSIAFARQRNFALAVVYFGYALANVGLLAVAERLA